MPIAPAASSSCINLVLYHGVLGPRAAWRAAVVPRERTQQGKGEALTEDRTGQVAQGATDAATPAAAERRARGRLWADLMRRTFGFDVLACPRCGGRLPSEVPAPTPARAPPFLDDDVIGVDSHC